MWECSLLTLNTTGVSTTPLGIVIKGAPTTIPIFPTNLSIEISWVDLLPPQVWNLIYVDPNYLQVHLASNDDATLDEPLKFTCNNVREMDFLERAALC